MLKHGFFIHVDVRDGTLILLHRPKSVRGTWCHLLTSSASDFNF